MKYETFQPVEALASFVRCYWTLDGTKEEITGKQTIVPDGCMEMIFHYGDLYRQYNGAHCITQPRCFVIGQLTRPLEVAPTGITGIFAVRFNPNGFWPFATVPLKDMAHTAVSLVRLFGAEGEQLGREVLSAGSAMERIACIERFLSGRLVAPGTVDRVVKSTVDTMLSANGQLPVERLSGLVHISRRQLERRFAAVIGLSPKQLSKTIKLQATLRLLLDKEYASLTALAYQGDYYDQAHFIKDFKELTGFTPKEFYGDGLTLSSHFYGAG